MCVWGKQKWIFSHSVILFSFATKSTKENKGVNSGRPESLAKSITTLITNIFTHSNHNFYWFLPLCSRSKKDFLKPDLKSHLTKYKERKVDLSPEHFHLSSCCCELDVDFCSCSSTVTVVTVMVGSCEGAAAVGGDVSCLWSLLELSISWHFLVLINSRFILHSVKICGHSIASFRFLTLFYWIFSEFLVMKRFFFLYEKFVNYKNKVKGRESSVFSWWFTQERRESFLSGFAWNDDVNIKHWFYEWKLGTDWSSTLAEYF